MKLEARLRAFAAFARQHSFSAAAGELRISQPAVSKHIGELETELGILLVDRSRRDGRLTMAGEFVAEHVLRAESLLAHTRMGAGQFRNTGVGAVVVVASSLTGRYLLPGAIADFQHLHANIRIDLQVATADRAFKLLRSNQAELGFVAGAPIAPEIEAEPLFEYEVVIAGRPGIVRQTLSRAAFRDVTWISSSEGSATRTSSDAGLAELGIVPARRLELPSSEAVLHALRKGYGIGAVSRYVAEQDLRSGTLTAFRLPGWKVRNVVSMIRGREAVLTPYAKRFEAHVRAHLRVAR